MLSIPLTSNKTVEIADLTHAVTTGNGVFDVLMRAVKAHLEQEWTAGRIKGTEYSTVYLSALQTTLQTALQFVLAQEKTNQEIALLKQQEANLVLEGVNLGKQALLIDAQKDVQVQQKANLVAEAAKSGAEKLFIDQKIITEKAQTDATVIGVGSSIDKQNAVYTAQAGHFEKDAQQKAAKIMVDAFNVQATVSSTLPNVTDAKLSATDIGQVITKLKAGIGA